MRGTSALVGAVASVALLAVPLSPASARGHHGGGLLFGLAALGTAVAIGVATVVTAPVRVLAAVPAYAPPVYDPPAYAPTAYAPPVYAAPAPSYSYAPPPAPAYAYAPPPGAVPAPPGYAYAPAPVYYAPAPAYGAPPGYVYVR